ncbi:hypothetical protein [Brucella intermedia]|uniref:hypothetical protein n=1 Tax=Brucella intermedia TaxID=94625 RepID=UPI002361DF53|nr:hypothetical protein [Brucella intermedia]
MRRINLKPDFTLPLDGIVPAETVEFLLANQRAALRNRQRISRQIKRLRLALEAERASARKAGYADGAEEFFLAAKELRNQRNRLYDDIGLLLRKCLEHLLLQMPSKDLIEATMTSILGGLRDGVDVTCMVHPRNISLVQQLIACRKDHWPQVACKVAANPELTERDCIMYAGPDVIDGGLSTILDELISALSWPSGDNHVPARNG